MKAKSTVTVFFLGVLFLPLLVLLNPPVMAGTTNIPAAGDRTFVLKSDGSLWAWGADNHGQVGDGATVNKPSPVQIGTDKDWASIATGTRGHTLAIKTDGTLWGWGSNGYDQLGDSTTVDKSSEDCTFISFVHPEFRFCMLDGSISPRDGSGIILLHKVRTMGDESLYLFRDYKYDYFENSINREFTYVYCELWKTTPVGDVLLKIGFINTDLQMEVWENTSAHGGAKSNLLFKSTIKEVKYNRTERE